MTKVEQMLYCPKCKSEYKDGSQRFCNNDGGRLQPVAEPGGKRSEKTQGVFTSLLDRSSAPFEDDEQLTHKSPPASDRRPSKDAASVTATDEKKNLFGSESVLAPDIAARKKDEDLFLDDPPLLEIDMPEPRVEKPNIKDPQIEHSAGEDWSVDEPVQEIEDPMPEFVDLPEDQMDDSPVSSRLVDPNEIESGRAPLGDRTVHPAGRMAFSDKKPDTLLGQTVKGRYRILKSLDADASSFAYLAEDNIRTGKNVVVRVLTKNIDKSSFEENIFQEERVSLSHVNHPNIANVIDSGELPEGKPFIVTAEKRDKTAANLIAESKNVSPSRVARIIRQASHGLNEVHQSGILHRNLRPDHILLPVTDTGNETVKVTDFCVSDGRVTRENFAYKAPEQIGGQLPTFSSDGFSLAIIAYEMLTGMLPFGDDSEKAVLGAQKKGIFPKPSHINDQIPPEVDAIFEKALAFEPSDRFRKARDFGEALYEALVQDSPELDLIKPAKPVRVPADKAPAQNYAVAIPAPSDGVDPDTPVADAEADFDLTPPVQGDVDREQPSKHSNEELWKNRSPEIVPERSLAWTLVPALGIFVLMLAAFGIWQYFLNAPSENVDLGEARQAQQEVLDGQGVDSPGKQSVVSDSEIETPPPPRQIVAPPKTVYFENSKVNMSEELAKKFRPFSLYYPESWNRKLFDKEQNKVDDKFLDIAISDSNGIPIEQFSISPYESNGTFKSDTELFAKLVEKSNKDTSEALRPGSFEVISQGATTIQNGRWKAYQVNFESKGQIDGKPLTIWGRRLWIPVQRPGAKTGFIITMLATSLSKDVKSADDVGKKGDLKQIVQTFEPSQEF